MREKKRARTGLEERRDEAGGDDPDGWSFEDGGSFSDGSSRDRIVRTGPRCNQTQDFKLCIIPVVGCYYKQNVSCKLSCCLVIESCCRVILQ